MNIKTRIEIEPSHHHENQIGWQCTYPDCRWHFDESLPYYEIVELFARHNLREHGGSIHARLEKRYKSNKNSHRSRR